MRPSQRATGTGIGSPETGKLATAFVVSPPQSSRRSSVFAITGECREGRAGVAAGYYATDGRRRSTRSRLRGARRSFSVTSSTGVQPRYPHSGHSGVSKCLKRSRRATRVVPHWRHSTATGSTAGPSARLDEHESPFRGDWRGETRGRSRRAGATVLVRALTECGQPAGVRAAETRDVVPPGSDCEARVLVERPHRVEQTP